MNITSKSYESLLPFLVVEAISAHESSFNSMSVKLIDQGWAWLVSGRKLLVWKFKETKDPSTTVKARRVLSPCFELQLPPSDLNHRADLIHSFFIPQNLNTSARAITIPAALTISPEGIIRFWSNVANERFTEANVSEIPGQEFCTLVSLSPLEYLLGTTTGSVYVLCIDIMAHDSRNVLLCSILTTPSGLLSGIGRRVTNLFFGPMSADVSAESRRSIVAVPKLTQSLVDKMGSTDRLFFVLSSTFKLRQWTRTNEGCQSTNTLLREWDLQRSVYNELISSLGLTQSDHINFWPIDMVTTKAKELLMLVVTLDTTRDNTVHYATCVFNPYQAGDNLNNLTVLRSHSSHYSNESEDQLLGLKFLERRTNGPVVFIHDRKFLFLVKIDQDILDAVDYANQKDGILGAGIVDNHPILFTQRDGLIYVIPVVSNNKSQLNETSIQFEPPTPVQIQTKPRVNSSTKADHSVQPMLVDIEMEEEEEDEVVDSNGAENRSTSIRFNNQSVTTDKSPLEQSTNPNRSTNQSTNQSTITSIAEQSIKKRGNDIDELLRNNKEFEWVLAIDNRQYGLASELLTKTAEEGELLANRKETLLALSKLAKLAE